MDKKTLLAFMIIAVIILLTPAYYNIIMPPQESDGQDSLYVVETEEVVHKSPARTQKHEEQTPAIIKNYKEKTYHVETDLYTAIISSNNGGSIKSFTLKKYSYLDDGGVELINHVNRENLLLTFRSVEGDQMSLSGPWQDQGNSSPGYIDEQFSLNFSRSLEGGWVNKKLTFNPDSYIINIETNLNDIHNMVSQGVYNLAWNGGLPSTEKNIKDDLTYFNSYIYQGGETHSPKIGENKNTREDNVKGETVWAAVRTKYFVSALIPDTPGLAGKTSGYEEGENKIFNVALVLSTREHSNTRLYLGPLEYKRVKALGVGLDSIMNFGWSFIRPISKGVHYLLIKMNTLIPNYGVVLIIFSILVKILVYPLTKKSYESTQKMQAVQPQLASLKEKYKNDQQKFAQAQMALFKENGVNPLGGCFPILLQMPLLFALFQVFRSTIELRGAPFVLWIQDLSSPDSVINLPFHIPIYGDHIAILPILMGITMFIQQKMMPTQASGQQKFMSYFMTIFFTLLFNNFPSGLNLYYTLFNALTIIQQKYLTPAPALTPPVRKK